MLGKLIPTTNQMGSGQISESARVVPIYTYRLDSTGISTRYHGRLVLMMGITRHRKTAIMSKQSTDSLHLLV